ncbi:putative mitochondrial protein AtMg00860 [Apium graveolens]|uniref:putative mitochondrial protein AtMg00860 n=1 Tax=Apium graveolens TaxID=4045 RepID=UPI003D79C057
MLRKFTLVFFDDILIYSKNEKEHLKQLQLVFEVMRKQKLFAKMPKFEFLQPQVAYLGHVISGEGVGEGVAVDGNKVKDMLAWPVPRSLKALRGFLGLSGYYRKFVKDYSTIAKPLTMLLQKDNFLWNEKAIEAFVMLKNALASIPVLKLPDFSKP